MSRNQIGQIMGCAVVAFAASVFLGWAIGSTFLKSIHPSLATMKVSTAVCFIASGFLLRFMAYPPRKTLGGVIEAWLVLCIVGYMALAVIPPLYGLSTGIENWVFPEKEAAVLSASPGMPSVGTMAAFMLIACAAFVNILVQDNAVRVRTTIGSIVVGIGTVALLGYATWTPILFYYCPHHSTAMALHTAILFVLCGAAILVIKPKHSGGDGQESPYRSNL